mmetsp:Transcript_72782/g.128239  ORF Transcript_72782/g.128239 Transcript_72782/m.128239 type:complete len:99 (+) Transcript_72782:135-431(+)
MGCPHTHMNKGVYGWTTGKMHCPQKWGMEGACQLQILPGHETYASSTVGTQDTTLMLTVSHQASVMYRSVAHPWVAFSTRSTMSTHDAGVCCATEGGR